MRVRWIDNAKGIAILCVILGHVGGGIYGRADLSFVYAFNLSVFFLLSGYTLKKQNITKDFINKKFKRFMTPYFYTCIAIILIDVFNTVFIVRDKRILTISYIVGKDIIRSFFASGSVTNFAGIEIGTRIGAIWFLPAMFFAILIVQWVLNQKIEEWKRCAVISFVALVGYISSKYIWLPFSVQAGMTASAFVLTGYYLKKHSILENLNWIHYLLFLLLFIWGAYKKYDRFYIVANVCPDLLITFFVSLSGSLLLIKLAKCIEKGKILNYIGRHSLYFLCAHLFVLETMGWYFNYIINAVGITGGAPYNWAGVVLNLIFCFFVSISITLLSQHLNGKNFAKAEEGTNSTEIKSINVLKGILIILMIVGNLISDSILRTIIFSCHMVAFIFLSGYSYRRKRDRIGVTQHFKAFLIPYGSFCFVHLLLHLKETNGIDLGQYIKSYLLAASTTGKLFTDVFSVGLIWFFNMSFLVSLIYMLIDYFIYNNWMKSCIILILSVIGVQLGNAGYWLPWSIDCALFCLIFYHIGVLCKQKDILNYLCECPALYFLFSIVWAYMTYTSSMDLSARQYSQYGIVVLGALCGIFLLYMCSGYIATNMQRISSMLSKTGENAISILFVHTLLGSYMEVWLAKYFNPENVGHLTINIVLQVFLGCAIGIILHRIIRKEYSAWEI